MVDARRAALGRGRRGEEGRPPAQKRNREDDGGDPGLAARQQRDLQPEDLAAAALMVAQLPKRARVPELVMIPVSQSFQ